MYFYILLRVGVVVALGSMVATHQWLLLGWAVVMLVYYALQTNAPKRLNIDDARNVFSASFLMQCFLSFGAAVVTGYTGLILLALGMSINTAVVFANGERMPYIGERVANDCYTELDESSRLYWLSDVLETTDRPGGKLLISVGDVLEVIGIWTLTAELLLP